MPRYEIPPDRQAEVLRLHYTGSSTRQIYLALHPPDAPSRPQLGTFTDTLNRLIAQTEEGVRRLALKEGVPFVSPRNPPTDAEVVELELAPAVREDPLDGGTEEALADLDAARGALCHQLKVLHESPLPPPPEKGFADPEGERAKASAAVANAIAANVSLRLRAAQLRVGRTVTLHNLRIAFREEEDARRRGENPTGRRVPEADSRADESQGVAPGSKSFLLALPSADRKPS